MQVKLTKKNAAHIYDIFNKYFKIDNLYYIKGKGAIVVESFSVKLKEDVIIISLKHQEPFINDSDITLIIPYGSRIELKGTSINILSLEDRHLSKKYIYYYINTTIISYGNWYRYIVEKLKFVYL